MAQRRPRLVTCLALAVVFAACGESRQRGPVERTWTEEVQLDDGSVAQVRRSVKLRITNSWAGDAYNAVEEEATLSFLGALRGLPTWSAPRMALVLYRDHVSGQWVIVSTTTSCEIWREGGKPKPPYWEYRLGAQGWMETPLSPGSIGRAANLLHIYDKALPSVHITEVERRLLQSDRRIATKYREISGDPDTYVCGEGNAKKPR